MGLIISQVKALSNGAIRALVVKDSLEGSKAPLSII